MRDYGGHSVEGGPEGGLAGGARPHKVAGMPPVVTRSTGIQGRALSEDERARAGRVAERLVSEVGQLVHRLPDHARGASGMARHLGVVRNTCQRIVSALQDGAPGAETIALLPGVKGLRQFLDAMRAHGFEASDTDAADVAVDDFERLIGELGGSHSKLSARVRITAEHESDEGGDDMGARVALYQSAAHVTGRSAEVNVSLYVFRPSPERDGMLERASAFGLIGNWVRTGGMPLVISSGETDTAEQREGAATLLDKAPAKGKTPDALLEAFTTMPLPTVTSRGTTKGHLMQIVDPAASAQGRLVDVVTATRSIHPEVDADSGKRTLHHIWSLTNCPSKHQVFDVFLHRDMERDYRPFVDVQQWNPSLSISEGDRWATRVPAHATLQLLGTGAAGARCEVYPRMPKLIETLMERVGWDAGEFVGFRCEMPYPVWRSGMCMSFEYLGRD